MFRFVKRWFKSMQHQQVDVDESLSSENIASKPSDTPLFSYPSDPEEFEHLERVLRVIQQTPAGRWLLRRLGQEVITRPILLRFSAKMPNKEDLGYVEDNTIFFKKQDLKKLSELEEKQLILGEACTLVHEIEHIRQKCIAERQGQKSTLPILYHIYLRLLEESAAYAREMFFEEELRIQYPVITRNMPMFCNEYKSGTKLIKEFMTGKGYPRMAFGYIDDFLYNLYDVRCLEMNHETKQEMIRRANTILKGAICSLTYEDVAFEKMRGLKSLKNGYAIQGHNMYLETDKKGRLVLIVDGCHHSPRERGVCLFEAPRQVINVQHGVVILGDQEGYELVRDDLRRNKEQRIFDKVGWSRPVRGGDDRVKRLLTGKNFAKTLNPEEFLRTHQTRSTVDR